MSDKTKKIALLIFLSVTFLCTGWVAGSSLGYRRGFAEAERQTTITHLDTENISQETQKLIQVAAKARFDLLIRYKNIPDRDFSTILAAHLKTSGELCDAYISFAQNKKLVDLCQNSVLPHVQSTRNLLQKNLVETGLN
jgi:hypothetical protein